jgi:hypothetical protein
MEGYYVEGAMYVHMNDYREKRITDRVKTERDIRERNN